MVVDFDSRLGINVIAVHDVGGRIAGDEDGLLLERKDHEEVIDQTMRFLKTADRGAEKLKNRRKTAKYTNKNT